MDKMTGFYNNVKGNKRSNDMMSKSQDESAHNVTDGSQLKKAKTFKKNIQQIISQKEQLKYMSNRSPSPEPPKVQSRPKITNDDGFMKLKKKNKPPSPPSPATVSSVEVKFSDNSESDQTTAITLNLPTSFKVEEQQESKIVEHHSSNIPISIKIEEDNHQMIERVTHSSKVEEEEDYSTNVHTILESQPSKVDNDYDDNDDDLFDNDIQFTDEELSQLDLATEQRSDYESDEFELNQAKFNESFRHNINNLKQESLTEQQAKSQSSRSGSQDNKSQLVENNSSKSQQQQMQTDYEITYSEEEEEEEDEEQYIPDHPDTPVPASTNNSEHAENSIILSPDEQHLSLDPLELPEHVLAYYRSKGVNSLMQWQYEALHQPGVLNNSANLIFSAPTSAGKTLVADTLLIRKIIHKQKKGLIILPYISLANEKVVELEKMLKYSSIQVGGFMGNTLPSGRFPALNVAVCTIEKANNIINRLIEEGTLDTIGIVIVDELHEVGVSDRGAILEQTLVKLKHEKTKNGLDLQIVGMSATLPNLIEIAEWLDAKPYITDYRPIPLQEMIMIKDKIYPIEDGKFDEKGEPLKVFDQINVKIRDEQKPSYVLTLCLETILDNNGVLIFCHSKSKAQNLAEKLSGKIESLCKFNGDAEHIKAASTKLKESILKKTHLQEIKEQLIRCPAKLDENLAKTVPNAVAFHHAGLSMDERDIIESGFKEGSIKALFATPTLSSGVNLPARRVIINSAKTGIEDLNALTYRQMKGRAGRKGIDTLGESIILATIDKNSTDVERIRRLVSSNLEPIKSKAIKSTQPDDPNSPIIISEALRRLALEPFAIGSITTFEELKDYLDDTLFAKQARSLTDDEIQQVLNELISNEGKAEATIQRITDANDVVRYIPSKLGAGILASSFPPDEALRLKKELEVAMNGISLNCDLHILYYVIPNENLRSRDINWDKFYNLLQKIHDDGQNSPKYIVMNLLGINIRFVMDQTQMKNQASTNSDYRIKHMKFYYAMALNEIMKEKSLGDVAKEFFLDRGDLQMLQQRSSSYCGMLAIFCKKLGWEMLSVIIKMFQDRLYFGISQELIDLMSISCLNAQMARSLHSAGFTEVKLIAHSNKFEIEKVLVKNAPENADLKRNWISSKCRSMSDSEISELIIKEARLVIEDNAGGKLKWDDHESIDINTAETTINGDSRSESPGSSASQENDKTKMRAKYVNDGLSQIKAPSPSRFIDTNIDSSSQSSIASTSTDHSRSPKKKSHMKRFQAYHSPRKALSSKKRRFYRSPLFSKGSKDQNQTTASDPSVIFSDSQNSSHNDRSTTRQNRPLQPTTSNTQDTTDRFEIEIEDSEMNSGVLNEIGSDQLTNSDFDRTSKQSNDSDFNILSQSPEVVKHNMDVELFETDEENQTAPEDESEMPVSSGSVGNVQKTVNKLDKKLFYDSPYNKKVDEKCFQIVDHNAFDICQSIGKGIKFQVRQVDQKNITSFIERFESTDVFIVYFKIETMTVQEDDFVNKKSKPAQDIRVKSEWLDKIERMCFLLGDQKIYCFNSNQKVQLLKQQLIKSKFTFLNSLVTGISYDAKVAFKIFKACFEFSDENIRKVYWHDPKVAHWMLNPDADEPESIIDIADTYLDSIESNVRLNFINKINEAKRSFKKRETKLKNEGKCDENLSDVEALSSTLLVYPIMSRLKHLLKDKCLYESYINIELPVLFVFARMELNGFTIDRKYMRDSFVLWRGMNEELENLIHNYLVSRGLKKIRDAKLNVRSPTDVKSYLDKLGLYKELLKNSGQKMSDKMPDKMSDKMIRSLGTGKETLEKLSKFSPFPGWISSSRKLLHMIDARDNLFNEMNRLNIENRVMGTYKHFMATGRISMVLPNLLGIDKDSKMEINDTVYNLSLKRVFTAKPGYVIVTADFCQLELRILSAICKEKSLINCFNLGKDPFKMIATSVHSKKLNEIDEFERNSAKQLMYAIIYGQGIDRLKVNLGVDDIEIAKKFLIDFGQAFPSMKTFVENSKSFAREHGYIETIFGRRRYLPNIDSNDEARRAGDERKAVNSRVQGSASDLVKLTMLKIDQALDNEKVDAEFLLQIHDELLFQVRDDKEIVKHFITLLLREMKGAGRVLKTKLDIKMKMGPNWSESKEIDPNDYIN